MKPVVDIDTCKLGHERLLATVERITGDDCRGPSLLPGWSRGHLLAHLARNADSHVFLLEGVRLGEIRRQYDCLEARESGISEGAHRSARVLCEDLSRACSELERAWAELPEHLWVNEVIVTPGPRLAHELPFRRLREVEVHHMDLNLGYSSIDWPEIYVEGELIRRLPGLPQRVDHRQLVSWLLNRSPAPELGPW